MIDENDLDEFMQSQAITQRDKLIAEQQIKIMELNEELERFKEGARKTHMIIYGIGGPLNDNKLEYTTRQMVNFSKIIRNFENCNYLSWCKNGTYWSGYE